eukprot:scaffold32881_cov80-Skeletonema_marinoi.AAC.2
MSNKADMWEEIFIHSFYQPEKWKSIPDYDIYTRRDTLHFPCTPCQSWLSLLLFRRECPSTHFPST